MKVLITPRGFANYGLDQVERMKSKGLEVHYNATGKAYTHEEFKALSKDADAIIVGVDKMDREMMEGCPNLRRSANSVSERIISIWIMQKSIVSMSDAVWEAIPAPLQSMYCL